MLADGQSQHVLRALRSGVTSATICARGAPARTGSAKRKRRVSCDSSVRLTSGSSTCALEQVSAAGSARLAAAPAP